MNKKKSLVKRKTIEALERDRAIIMEFTTITYFTF